MKNELQLFLLSLFISVVMAQLTRHFVFFVTKVVSLSMLPTLQINKRLLTLRIYHPEHLNRGELVVFYSTEVGMTMIKRLIGLPGDSILIRTNGDLLINGSRQIEPYVKHSGGKGGSFLVPKDEYFFLGDNRAESTDSRHWGCPTIPAKDIQGKVVLCNFKLKMSLK